MTEETTSHDLSFFDQKQLRRVFHQGEWYYSITDVIVALTDSTNPRVYWAQLKARAKTEQGFDEALAQIAKKPLPAKDGRLRETDVANRQTILRIIQSIPSPRAEPFRLWLAQVGEERFEEIEHPEAVIERMRAIYRAKGYDDAWIETRIKSDLIRNELTDEWHDRGAQEGVEYAILTNELIDGTFSYTVVAYKRYKVLPTKANLRDHMTPIELALTSLSEATAITYHRDRDSQGFSELRRDTIDAGAAAGDARKALEKRIGKSVISPENYLHLKKVKGKTKAQKRLKEGKPPSLFDEPGQEEGN